MKKSDSEYLRNWYSFFTLDYEVISEKLFMCRVWLVASVMANLTMIAVIVVMCFFMESCCVNVPGSSCKPTASVVLDNEHVSKRTGKLGNVYTTGFSCQI